MKLCGQNIRVSIVDIEEILPTQSRRPGGATARWGYAPSASKTAVTNAYHLSNQGRVADEFS